MTYTGTSFPFSDLASPDPPPEPEPEPFTFDPEKVQRITIRWTRAMALEREEELMNPEKYVLGPRFHPRGIYVFASDFDHLLQLYKDLKAREGQHD